MKKLPPPLYNPSRRNTAPANYLDHIAAAHLAAKKHREAGGDEHDTSTEQPMGMVTTIVANNEPLRKKRSSRFRLSLSRGRGSILGLNTTASSQSLLERSVSRATMRTEGPDRSSSRATQRIESERCSSRTDERGADAGRLAVRKRADTKVSDPDTVIEEGRSGEEEEEEDKKGGEDERESGRRTDVRQKRVDSERDLSPPKSPLEPGVPVPSPTASSKHPRVDPSARSSIRVVKIEA